MYPSNIQQARVWRRGAAAWWRDALIVTALAATVFFGLRIFRPPIEQDVEVPGPRAAWFVDIAGTAGLDFVHRSGGTGRQYLPEIMGAGAALFDYDGDADLDVYLTGGNDHLPETTPADAHTGRLYARGANGRYTDVTVDSGLSDGGYGMGAAVGDIDNDGDLDLYLTRFGADRLYLNQGDGTFVDHTTAAGIRVDGWSCSALFLDYDRDGDLDLYVTRYVRFEKLKRCTDNAGRPDYCTPDAFPAEQDVLLRNEGNGRFSDVTEGSGVSSALAAAGLGVACADFDADGWIDVYVANDGDPNHLWINQGDGTFRDMALQLGVAYNASGNSEAGMGVLATDLDADGRVDVFLTHLDGETNTYYRNLGGRVGFEDVTARFGLAGDSLSRTGFGTAAIDIESDGDLDVLIANGRVTHDESRSRPPGARADVWGRYAEHNQLYLSNGRGFEVADVCGDLCRHPEISRGLATGDIDDDGDVDVLLAQVEGPVRLLENRAPRGGHWLRVDVREPELKRTALGAHITVRADGKTWAAVVGRGGSYLSSSDPRVHIGLGTTEHIEAIEVAWPDGASESFPCATVDRSIVLIRGSGSAVP